MYNNLIKAVREMETIFVNKQNSKTYEARRLELHLADKIDLKIPNKNIALVAL